MLPKGSPLPSLSATTVDGRPAPATGPLLIGFFSPDCRACVQRLPGFVEYAKAFDGHVLGVAVGPVDEVSDLVDTLHPVADVVVEPPDGPLATLLRVKGLPAMATTDTTGVVVASGYDLTALPSLTTV